MTSIDWKTIHQFYSELWADMPFKNQTEAQEFMDLAVSKVRFDIWRSAESPVPHWIESLTNENVSFQF